jgi:hypothetical protein
MADANDDDRDLEAMSLLAASLPPVEPSPAARSRFQQALHRARFAPFAPEIAEKLSIPTEILLAALERVDDDDAWIGLPTQTLRFLHVRDRIVISRLRAGTHIPHHRHATREFTYVLDGVLLAGEVEHGRAACLDMPPGTEHELRVSEDGDCLVVFALL